MSFSNRKIRLDVRFGVSYDSDPHQVKKLACEAVASLPRVEEAPVPACHISGFGDSSLDFVLRFWIKDPENGVTNIKGDAFLALWDAFKAHDIAIPYPHREVILSGEGLARLRDGSQG